MRQSVRLLKPLVGHRAALGQNGRVDLLRRPMIGDEPLAERRLEHRGDGQHRHLRHARRRQLAQIPEQGRITSAERKNCCHPQARIEHIPGRTRIRRLIVPFRRCNPEGAGDNAIAVVEMTQHIAGHRPIMADAEKRDPSGEQVRILRHQTANRRCSRAAARAIETQHDMPPRRHVERIKRFLPRQALTKPGSQVSREQNVGAAGHIPRSRRRKQ